jgi:hypothetical protein
MFNIVVTSTEAQREAWLSEVVATVNRFFPKVIMFKNHHES